MATSKADNRDQDEHNSKLDGIDEDYLHFFADLSREKLPLFHRCALNEDLAELRILLEDDAGGQLFVNVDDGISGRSALHVACLLGHYSVAKVLIEEGKANVNVLDVKQFSPLHYACAMPTAIELFGSSHEHQQHDKITLLQRQISLLELLLSHGADNTISSSCSKTPLHVFLDFLDIEQAPVAAHEKKKFEDLLVKVMDVLLAHHNFANQVPLVERVNMRDEQGWTLLDIAAQKDIPVIISYLLARHADANNVDLDGQSPLHKAVESGSLASTLLIAAHANVNLTDAEHQTAVLMACRGAGEKQFQQIAIQLVKQHHANVNIQDANGYACLHLATHLGDLELVTVLLQQGKAKRDVKTKKHGLTPLHIACKHGNLEIVKLIVSREEKQQQQNQNQQNKNKKQQHKQSSQQSAAQANNDHSPQIDASLIEAQDVDGRTPLMYAIQNNNIPIVSFLLPFTNLSKHVDRTGNNCLHLSVEKSLELTLLLLNEKSVIEGGMVNAVNADGQAPIIKAVVSGQVEVAKKLLSLSTSNNSSGFDVMIPLLYIQKQAQLLNTSNTNILALNKQVHDLTVRVNELQAANTALKQEVAQLQHSHGNQKSSNSSGSNKKKKNVTIVEPNKDDDEEQQQQHKSKKNNNNNNQSSASNKKNSNNSSNSSAQKKDNQNVKQKPSAIEAPPVSQKVLDAPTPVSTPVTPASSSVSSIQQQQAHQLSVSTKHNNESQQQQQQQQHAGFSPMTPTTRGFAQELLEDLKEEIVQHHDELEHDNGPQIVVRQYGVNPELERMKNQINFELAIDSMIEEAEHQAEVEKHEQEQHGEVEEEEEEVEQQVVIGRAVPLNFQELEKVAQLVAVPRQQQQQPAIQAPVNGNGSTAASSKNSFQSVSKKSKKHKNKEENSKLSAVEAFEKKQREEEEAYQRALEAKEREKRLLREDGEDEVSFATRVFKESSKSLRGDRKISMNAEDLKSMQMREAFRLKSSKKKKKKQQKKLAESSAATAKQDEEEQDE